jgi:hypothetical protein
MSFRTSGGALAKLIKGGLDDDEEAMFMIAQSMCASNKQERMVKWYHERLDWDGHVEKLRHTGGFGSRYHMTEKSFVTLVDILRDRITVDFAQSMRSTSGNTPIYPELVCGVGIRYFGGDSLKTLSDVFGMSESSAERVMKMFLEAAFISEHPLLEIKLPDCEDELNRVASEWSRRSMSFGLLDGFISAMDGWLCCINKPWDVDNPGDYFSGHYQRFGLNVQAACDANLIFIYVSVAAPGRTNDQRAFKRLTRLNRWLQSLASGFFFGGDNAYPLLNNLLIPFSGSQAHDPSKRSFNFLLSQLRIRIEMAFGRLSTKWRIFRRNLDLSTELNSKVVEVAMKLHNFVIRSDGLNFVEVSDDKWESLEVETWDKGPEGNKGYLEHVDSCSGEEDDFNSIRRNYILQEIINRGIIHL